MSYREFDELIKPLEGKFTIQFKDGNVIIIQEEMTQEEYDAI